MNCSTSGTERRYGKIDCSFVPRQLTLGLSPCCIFLYSSVWTTSLCVCVRVCVQLQKEHETTITIDNAVTQQEFLNNSSAKIDDFLTIGTTALQSLRDQRSTLKVQEALPSIPAFSFGASWLFPNRFFIIMIIKGDTEEAA